MADRGLSDLISTASSLLNSQAHSSSPSQGHASSTSEGGNGKPHSSASSHTHKPSSGEVYASAQVVMNAAKNKLHKGDSSAEEIDYGKLAGAAETLIGAAAHYGKLEEGAYGKYAQKAQEYLHAYGMKHGKPGMNVPPSQPPASQGHSPAPHTPSVANPSAPPQGYPTGYSPQGYPDVQQGYSAAKPSAPPQGYPTGYPPQGYPDVQQGYGYVSQGHSKPAESHVNVDNYPPVGYPPAGYPPSGTNYNQPSKYS